jgi:hypothetical protein
MGIRVIKWWVVSTIKEVATFIMKRLTLYQSQVLTASTLISMERSSIQIQCSNQITSFHKISY